MTDEEPVDGANGAGLEGATERGTGLERAPESGGAGKSVPSHGEQTARPEVRSAPPELSGDKAADDRAVLEQRIRAIGERLLTGVTRQGSLRAASSLLGGRALQRRVLGHALEDEHFKTQLFRFVDVYPSLRDSGDVVRHLRAYLDEGGALPRPLDRLLAMGDQRLPSWAVARLTERGMQRMARSLIAGRDTVEALPTLQRLRRRHTGFTLDILGEACLSDAEAAEYARRYLDVLDVLPPRASRWSADSAIDRAPWGEVPRVNLSLKITSLYSQIDPVDFEGSKAAVAAALKPLLVAARNRGVFVNLDLERFVYRDLTHAIFSDIALDEDLRDYPHLGVVVQAYLRDSERDVENLIALARRRGTPLTVRLVKGAYWDYETIIAAQEHWPSPVFGHKAETDAQFERLTGILVKNWEWTRPAIGSHNIRSMAAAIAMAEKAGLPSGALELQMLHGMAEPIRRAAVGEGYRVREYVPVGELIPGMAYLVRRLLENTANESFLRLAFARQPDAAELLAPPETMVRAPEAAEPGPESGAPPAAGGADGAPTRATPLLGAAVESPAAAHVSERARARFTNEPHADFSSPESRVAMEKALATIRGSLGRKYALLIGGAYVETSGSIVSVNPARPAEVVGIVARASRHETDQALDAAHASFPAWRDTPPAERAGALVRAAGIMRSRRAELAALEVVEAGKPWREADADVTEAIDFLEFYAGEMLRLAPARDLSDVPGEEDIYFYEPRGVAVVIAPWNFPLAIPTGMVSAALVAGNTVVFKPANPTPVLGYAMVRILHEAGVPGGAVNYLPGPGSEVGDYLAGDPRVDMIAFTGSLDVGLSIMSRAAVVAPGQRNIKKVVAEMGGKNAIIVDTDADLDAAVEGVVASAFNYAGQKCSACSRVVVLEPVYDQFLRRLVRAAASLKVGDPSDPGSRVGPVITADARDRILRYIHQGSKEAQLAFPDEPQALAEASQTLAEASQTLAEASQTPPGAPRESPEAVAPDPSTGPQEELVASSAAQEEGGPGKSGAAAAAFMEPAALAEELRHEEGVEQAGTADEAPDETAGEATDEAADESDESTQPLAAGYFVGPHVFAGVSPEATIAQEEIFGPVLAVLKARDFSHALELALGVRYGLTGGLYSRNPERISRAYREFRVGNLYINRPITGAMVGRQPFGGSRMSGVGSKAGGPDYLLQFLEPRTVTENTVRRGFAPEPDGSVEPLPRAPE